ncbi:hypothetical protein [Nocardioides sp. Soil777]|uniref:hypothetical protein n=1 Tax=Nocardioides sp. Soil777 TaxID=1736409 RepID=UPI000B0A17B9|nr:hypothetical protein [Nocardioides sp. Soil777]
MSTAGLHHHRGWVRRLVAPMVVALGAATMTAGVLAVPATAASSDACTGGGFRLVNLTTGATVASSPTEGTVSAAALGERFGVRGVYNQFDVRASDFAVLDYAFTGAANEEDMTGGRFTPVWASKVPDHRGATLTSGVEVSLDEEDLVIMRTGSAVSMKIQAKDCAQGGIFQMEPERGDGQTTRIVHTLAQSSEPGMTPFFFDNTNFRERVGQFLGADCTSVVTGPPSQFCVQVNTRTNIGNDVSPAFVARDSAQVAERVDQPQCNTATPVTPSAEHCGSQSIWDVASGGRMGFVTGEDAVEVANPPTDCVEDCQAQNQVRGRLAVLGFPFPVPAGSRLTPATAAGLLPAPPSLPGSPSTGTPAAPSQVRLSAPQVKKAVAGRAGGRATATARWKSVAGAAAYQVRAVRVGARGKAVTSDKLSGSARSRTMVLKRGTYRFKIRALNAAGASSWSTMSNKVRAR